MKLKIFISLLIACLSLSSCCSLDKKSQVNEQPNQIAILKTELASLNLENPTADMERNFNHGDKRFIGIYGFVLYCPGTQGVNYDFIKRYGVRAINGTSDVIEGQEHIELMKSATEYAEQYNQGLLKKLK